MARGKDENMTFRILGAVFVIVGCGSVGRLVAASKRNEMRTLRDLIAILDLIECELQYRVTPLPGLCHIICAHTNGVLKQLFLSFTEELEKQISPNVEVCMKAAIEKTAHLPELTKGCVTLLGQTLGNYELEGQLRSILSVRDECTRILTAFSKDIDVRIRCYQTLSLCAGAALAIIFI